jgi:vanillate/4-hydroxybenzoate decarboxylase subunit D
MSFRNDATSKRLYLDRERVEGACPRCGAEDLAKYPVNSEGGWFIVVKCQGCLHSVSRERWNLLGPITLLVDSVEGATK